ncbi:MAG: hypothetical protein HY929_03595 [Euryarchaeota archaeon]|nr:hypothetical protein [Euryarchaeota archaeon]
MKILNDQSGQAALEYMLMVATALAIVSVVVSNLRVYSAAAAQVAVKKFQNATKLIYEI